MSHDYASGWCDLKVWEKYEEAAEQLNGDDLCERLRVRVSEEDNSYMNEEELRPLAWVLKAYLLTEDIIKLKNNKKAIEVFSIMKT